MKRYVLLLWVVLVSIQAFAYNITGKVLDKNGKQPLPGATVKLLVGVPDSVINYTITNTEGKFVIKGIHYKGDVSITISCLGYDPISIDLKDNCKSVDLDDILMTEKVNSLGEVVVSANESIEKYDRTLVFPTIEERKNASDIIGLLTNMRMKLPGIDVNELTRSVTIDGKEPVYQINGKVEPLSKIRMINKNRILRIEYRNQADIRFSNDETNAGVINFILKNDFDGGNFHTREGVTETTPRINGEVGFAYNNRRSEWSLNYDNVWRNSTKQYTNNYEKYIGEDYEIERQQVGLPSSFKDFDNNLSVGYTYRRSQSTTFTTDLSLRYHNVDATDKYMMRQIKKDLISEYSKINTRNSETIDPALNLYFNKNFGKQVLEFDLTGVYSSGDYDRGMNYIYTPTEQYIQKNKTNNKSYLIGSEVLYSRTFKSLTAKFGVNYSYNYVTNGYFEGENEIENTLAKHKMYVYGSMGGKLGKFSYDLGVGGRYEAVSNDGKFQHSMRPNVFVSFSYPILKKTSVNLNYTYMPSLPSLFNFSEVMQTIDDISLQTGSLNIRPMEFHKVRLSSRSMVWKLSVNLSAEYSRTTTPLINIWEYDSGPDSQYYDKFISRTANGKWEDYFNCQMDISSQRFFNCFAVFGQFGWGKYRISVRDNYKYTHDQFFAALGVNAVIKNVSIITRYDILPRYSISGLSVSSNSGSFYMGVNWRYKNVSAGVMAGNLFTSKANRVKTTYISSIRPATQEYYIKDFSNLIELTFQYNIDFGKKFGRTDRSLSGDKIDRGVNNAY